MDKRRQSGQSSHSKAEGQLCQCRVCAKTCHNNPVSLPQIALETSGLEMPSHHQYQFVLDCIIKSQLGSKLPFKIVDCFFFEDNKVCWHYHHDRLRGIIKEPFTSAKEMERILKRKKGREFYSDEQVISQTITQKDVVANKIKNKIGVIVYTDGTFKVLNELNMAFQVSISKNINMLKLFKRNIQLIPVYYNYRDIKARDLFNRSRNYIKALTKEITSWDILFVPAEEESKFEYTLYNDNRPIFLTYLSFKLVHLILLDCIRVNSAIFVWMVDQDTTMVYLYSVHSLRYSKEKDPDQELERYINHKRQKVETKLKNIKVQNSNVKPNAKVAGFQRILNDSFRIVKQELAPNLQLKTESHPQMDEAFKKLHPEANYRLSDIVKNDERFKQQMKKLFTDRFSVIHRRVRTETPKALGKLNTKQKTVLGPRTIVKSSNSNKCLTEQDSTSRKTRFASDRKPRNTSMFSLFKLGSK